MKALSAIRSFYLSIDRPMRMTVLNWGFLVIGLVAFATAQLPIIWLAWVGAAIAYLLRDSRLWVSALLFVAFTAASFGLYVWIDAALIKYFDWPLPFSGDYLNILPSSGIMMEFLLAIAARDGRYKYEHEAWQTKNPLSRAYVPMELERRRRDEEAERTKGTVDIEKL